MKFVISSATLLLALVGHGCATIESERPSLTIAPHEFATRDGRVVEAETGRFSVPENRADPESRMIELAFVRFPSTSATPGNPIVYLAGGPGGSGTRTAADRRFDVFMALREQADVIAFDQRGTGLSETPPACVDDTPLAADAPLTRDAMIGYVREETARCVAWWREQGVDIAAWNTRENAADIEDLRRAIGAEQIDLWAISYGTHLGAAYLREHDDKVGRAVFAGYEGPGDTVKLPSRTDAYFQRLAASIAADPQVRAVYPDFPALMRRVLGRLKDDPVAVTFTPRGATEPVTMTIGAFPVQIMTGAMISDPGRAARLPALYLGMDHGHFEPAAAIIHQFLFAGSAGMNAMSTAMDYASGVTAARLAQVEVEAEDAVLADALNFPMPHVLGAAPELDLGDAFRAPLKADTPILLISGTLDGRTYPEAARDALSHLPSSRQLIVENGGHNIYEADPRMIDVVRDWLRDATAPGTMAFAPPEAFRHLSSAP